LIVGELFKLGLCNSYFPGSTLHFVIGLFAVVLIGYLLGSLNFGVIISKAFYGGDVRKHGSGASGATNMQRTYGNFPAAMTFLGDGLKTAAAVFVGALFLGRYNAIFYVCDGASYASFDALLRGVDISELPAAVSYTGFAGMYIGGAASIAGHAFPVYYGFKGGKCIASTFFLVLCTEPLVALVCLLFFIAVVWATKFISAGSVMCVIVYPLILNRLTGAGLHNIVAILIALFVVTGTGRT